MSITALMLFFLCGEASNETGRFRGGGIQRGQSFPWHTILPARSSVLYLLRRAATEGACDGAAQGPFGDAGQAGFAGRMAENTGACEKQSSPVRLRLRALGWSEAEEQRAQPGCRRYIKTLVPRLSYSAFSFYGAIAFRIFRLWMYACFLHYAFSESKHIRQFHSQMNCPQSRFSKNVRIVFVKTSPEINFPFAKNVCDMESRRCASAVSSIPLARLSDK